VGYRPLGPILPWGPKPTRVGLLPTLVSTARLVSLLLSEHRPEGRSHPDSKGKVDI